VLAVLIQKDMDARCTGAASGRRIFGTGSSLHFCMSLWHMLMGSGEGSVGTGFDEK
jgi:hypothetical protein